MSAVLSCLVKAAHAALLIFARACCATLRTHGCGWWREYRQYKAPFHAHPLEPPSTPPAPTPCPGELPLSLARAPPGHPCRQPTWMTAQWERSVPQPEEAEACLQQALTIARRHLSATPPGPPAPTAPLPEG